MTHGTLPMAALALAALSGCASLPAPSAERVATARLGEAATPGPLRITPLAVLEDSRCPAGTYCIWAGQVRVSVRIEQNDERREVVLTAGKPVAVRHGTVELHTVMPGRTKEAAIPPRDYRFGFRFNSGA